MPKPKGSRVLDRDQPNLRQTDNAIRASACLTTNVVSGCSSFIDNVTLQSASPAGNRIDWLDILYYHRSTPWMYTGNGAHAMRRFLYLRPDAP